MFCENCGKEIREGQRFCENCGTPVMQSVQGQAAEMAEQASTAVN